VDFLSVLIELFSLGVTAEALRSNIQIVDNVDWKSSFLKGMCHFGPKFQGGGRRHPPPMIRRVAKLDALWYKNVGISLLVLSQFTHLTDGQTFRSWLYGVCIATARIVSV